MIPRVVMKKEPPKRHLHDVLSDGLYRCLEDSKFKHTPAPDAGVKSGDLVLVMVPYNDDPSNIIYWHLRTGNVWVRKMRFSNFTGDTGKVEVVRERGVSSVILYEDETE